MPLRNLIMELHGIMRRLCNRHPDRNRARSMRVVWRSGDYSVRLPTEVWENVFRHLDTAEVLRVRLVSHYFKTAATRAFMRTFNVTHMYLLNENIDRLDRLFHNFSSPKIIETLIVEPIYFKEPDHEALENCIKELDRGSESSTTLADLYSAFVLWESLYTSQMLEQYHYGTQIMMKQLHGNFECHDQSGVVKALSTESWPIRSNQIPRMKRILTEFGGHTLRLHNRRRRDDLAHHFLTRTLIPSEAIRMSLRRLEIKACISLHALPTYSTITDPVFPNLYHLHLRLIPDPPNSDWTTSQPRRTTSPGHLSNFLSHMPNLIYLEIAAPIHNMHDTTGPWAETTSSWMLELSEKCHFKNLAALSIWRWHIADHTYLADFLYKHKTTLKVLKMNTVYLPFWIRYYNFVIQNLKLDYYETLVELSEREVKRRRSWRLKEPDWKRLAKVHKKEVCLVNYDVC